MTTYLFPYIKEVWRIEEESDRSIISDVMWLTNVVDVVFMWVFIFVAVGSGGLFNVFVSKTTLMIDVMHVNTCGILLKGEDVAVLSGIKNGNK